MHPIDHFRRFGAKADVFVSSGCSICWRKSTSLTPLLSIASSSGLRFLGLTDRFLVDDMENRSQAAAVSIHDRESGHGKWCEQSSGDPLYTKGKLLVVETASMRNARTASQHRRLIDAAHGCGKGARTLLKAQGDGELTASHHRFTRRLRHKDESGPVKGNVEASLQEHRIARIVHAAGQTTIVLGHAVSHPPI
jgi:hypothetical protein